MGRFHSIMGNAMLLVGLNNYKVGTMSSREIGSGFDWSYDLGSDFNTDDDEQNARWLQIVHEHRDEGDEAPERERQ